MTTINPKTVAERFAKAHHSYGTSAHAQHYIAHKLIQLLRQNLYHHANHLPSPDTVLEIGCGVGNFSRLLLEHYPAINKLWLNDLYPKVQDNLLPKHTAQLEYCIGDINVVSLPQRVDWVVSSSAVQWIYPQDKLFGRLYECLNPQGLLVLSSFSVDNCHQIRQLTEQGLCYYHQDEWAGLCQKSGFVVLDCTNEHYSLYFDHPYDILKHLKNTGVTGTTPFRWSKKSLQHFVDNYPKDEQGYALTYHPMYLIAQKMA